MALFLEVKIKTSYFSMMDLIKYPIAICGKKPDWYLDAKLPVYNSLAPKKGFFMDWKNGVIDNNGYIKEYIKQVLMPLDPKTVYSELLAIYPGVQEDQIMLLCYEPRGQFCHRHIVSAWFRTNGFVCNEFNP